MNRSSEHGLGKARQKVASPRDESMVNIDTVIEVGKNRLSSEGGNQDTAGFYKIIR